MNDEPSSVLEVYHDRLHEAARSLGALKAHVSYLEATVRSQEALIERLQRNLAHQTGLISGRCPDANMAAQAVAELAYRDVLV